MSAQARTRPPLKDSGARCSSDRCRAAIRWVKTVDGQWMPLDMDRVPDGTVVAEQVRGQWRVRVLRAGEAVDPRRPRWSPHWSTCPDVEMWGEQRRKADPTGETAPRRPAPGLRRLDTWACAGCYWPDHLLDSGSTLCEVCSEVLAAWRAKPGPHRGPIPYPRWNRETGQRDPYRPPRTHLPPAPTVPAAAVPQPGTLLAVDGPSLAHRAWYAYERSGMTAPDGRRIHAVYGFLALLVGVIDRVRPDALVVGFDDRASSVRRDAYPAYKAGRAERDADLHTQMADIVAVLQALGVRVIVPDGLEADDVLGSAAAAAEATGWRCVLATSDKDSFALISEATTVLRLVSGLDNAVLMDPARLVEEYGVTPGQYADYCALVGDTSDNLPGVLGIGPKTAARLLAAMGSVDAALEDPTAAGSAVGKAAAAKLRTEQARAALDRNRQIMAIRRDVPVDPQACRPQVDPRAVAAVLRERHLPKLTDRVTAALCRPARAGRRNP